MPTCPSTNIKITTQEDAAGNFNSHLIRHACTRHLRSHWVWHGEGSREPAAANVCKYDGFWTDGKPRCCQHQINPVEGDRGFDSVDCEDSLKMLIHTISNQDLEDETLKVAMRILGLYSCAAEGGDTAEADSGKDSRRCCWWLWPNRL